MATPTDTFDLGALRLTSGEGRHLDLGLAIEPYELGGHTYQVTRLPDQADTDGPEEQIPATLDLSKMTAGGYALHLQFGASLNGPCMRCLEPARQDFRVDSREVSQPGEDDEEFESPYVIESILDVAAWARDALALTLPPAIICKPDCLGLCPVCGENLNTAGPEHVHEAEPDPRWAVLSELKLDAGDPDVPAVDGQTGDTHTASGPDTAETPESGVE